MLSQMTLSLFMLFILQAFLAAGQDSTNYCITRPTDCYTIPLPVCGYPLGCTDGSCSKNFTNACFACQDLGIETYVQGQCPPYVPDNQHPGTGASEEEDNLETEIDIEPEHQEQEGELPSACPDLGVALLVDGEFVEGKFCCDVMPNNCPQTTEPVCAVLYTCIGSTCQVTKQNSCRACQDTNVQLYIPGKCSDVFGPESGSQDDIETEGQDDADVQPEITQVNSSDDEPYIAFVEGENSYTPEEKKIWVSWHN